MCNELNMTPVFSTLIYAMSSKHSCLQIKVILLAVVSIPLYILELLNGMNLIMHPKQISGVNTEVKLLVFMFMYPNLIMTSSDCMLPRLLSSAML